MQLPHNPHGSSESRIAAAYADAIKAQQNFELLLTTSGGSSSCASSSSSLTLSAQFRCSANTSLDNNMLPIGIPNCLRNEDNSGSSTAFYFATLRQAPALPHSNISSSSKPSSSQQFGSDASNPGNSGNKGRSKTTTLFSIMAGMTEPFTDVKLGALLGRGAFGRVFRGE